MKTTKISSKGQVVIPNELREKLNIKPGAYFHVRIEKGNILLTPMKASPIERLYGKFAGEKVLDELERDHANEIAKENRT